MTSAGGAIAMALFGMALVSIVRDTGTSWLVKPAWAVVTLILPIVGPILWFAIGKRYPYGVNGGNS
jgi:tryptophan-rich sensory protein